MKVALKAARVCIEGNELDVATKVLGQAADYQEILSKMPEGEPKRDVELADGLLAQYYAVRMTLSWRQDRMDMANHMFEKCKQLGAHAISSITEQLADLLYEIGKAALVKRNYEVAARWLEHAYDVLGEHDLDSLSLEIGELRLSTMQSLGRHTRYASVGNSG
jgi:tetratricopeptide (TPR) repeat protein